MASSFRRALPLSTASFASFRHSSRLPFSARYSMWAASSRQICVRSSGPSPRSVSTASSTSSELPILWPSGMSMLVISAPTFRPACSPMATIFSASVTACSFVFINAPLPHFTSSRMQSLPAASFLLIMDIAISGMLSTVPVTSRSAYIFLSAGVRFPDCPMTHRPISFTMRKNSSRSSATCMPGIDSSLSTVPPV